MKQKNKNIKKFYKKNILPSVLLLVIFVGFCAGMFVSLFSLLEVYLLGTKAEKMDMEAKHLSSLITSRIQSGESLRGAVIDIADYLKEDNAFCITDETDRILYQSGQTAPDFAGRRVDLGPGGEWVYGDLDPRGMGDPPLWKLSYDVLLQRALKPMPKGMNEEVWLRERIFTSFLWIEIPVQEEGYHVYYRDSAVLTRRNALYVIGVSTVGLLMLLLPIILLLINIISSVVTQRRMVYLLYLDTVTGGRNWLYFTQRSQKTLSRTGNIGNTYAVVNLHLERFQDYCACYGSNDGDQLLRSMNGYLQANIRKQEGFARFAGADFGMFLKCDSLEQCEKRVRKFLAELTGIRSDKILAYHAGIYLIPPSERTDAGKQERKGIDMDQLYSYANAARETIDGKDGVYIKVFDDQILQEQMWKRRVEDTMEDALLNKEFQVYLQPKYNPVSQKIVGAEALVRWDSPAEGIILPKRFISIFEENGFIARLDDYMISAAAKLQAEWKLQGRKVIPISVNVSRASFTRTDLAQHVCHLVDGYGTEHEMIELELTESAFFGDKRILQQILKELKEDGFKISMDDFGAGYSSLNSLKDLPIDTLKLDVEFFQDEDTQRRGEDTEKRGRLVIKDIIHLARNLDMKIVAEGIEREDQVEFLVEQDCDMIQGFYYARPMPISEFDRQMEQNG